MTSAAARMAEVAGCSSLVLCAALTAGGCRRPQARTVPEMPALDVPPPPPRDRRGRRAAMPPADSADRGAGRTAPEPPRVPPPKSARDAAQRTEAPKPEPAPEAAQTAEGSQAVAGDDAADDPGRPGGRARASDPRCLLEAADDLNRVDYRKLNADVQAAVRHRQELHPPGRGCAENQESGLRRRPWPTRR